MVTSRRWYVLLAMVIASVFLVLLAGNLEDWRTPEKLVPLPLVAVGILGSAISIFVLSLVYAVVVIVGGPTQTVPKIMLVLVAMLATACALLTGIELLGYDEHIAHVHPGLVVALAVGHTVLTGWLGAAFDREAVSEEDVEQLETLRRPGGSSFSPQETLEM